MVTVNSTAFPASQVASGLAIAEEFKVFNPGSAKGVPIEIGIFGCGNTAATYTNEKTQLFDANQAGEKYGFGSPIHMAAVAIFKVPLGGVSVYAFPVDDGTTPAEGDITPSGTATKKGTFRFKVNDEYGEFFEVEVGDTLTEILPKAVASLSGATRRLPINASNDTTEVGVTVKWGGTLGNEITLGIEGPNDTGISWAFTQPTGGAGDPSPEDALERLGNKWTNLICNCIGNSETTLNFFQEVGELRWSSEVHKPFVAFYGSNESDVTAATTITDARSLDRNNGQLLANGSPAHPITIGASILADAASLSNTEPGDSFEGRPINGLAPGPEEAQWDNAKKNAAMKKGSSTSDVEGNQVVSWDLVTMSHPEGDDYPPFQKLSRLVKLWTVMFGIDRIFSSAQWKGKKLVPDNQVVTNPNVRKFKQAKGALIIYAENLGKEGLISDPDFTKANIQVGSDPGGNPDRINMRFPVKLSGNTNVKAVTIEHGYYNGE